MRQKGFILLPVLIIIVLLGVVGYLVYKNTQLQKNIGNPTSPSAVPTANLPKFSPTPDPTANWKIYTDKYFSIKYPKNINIEQLTTNINNDMIIALKSLRNVSDPPLVLTGVKLISEQYDAYIYVVENKNKLDFKNWYEKYTYYPGSVTQDTYSSSFPDENPKSIDNLINYQWYSGVTSTDREEFVSIQNDKVVSVDVSRKVTQQRETFYQILSTFKFTQ